MDTAAARHTCPGGVGVIVNTRLISHPMNWLIVFLMLVIAGMFVHLVMHLLDQAPATAATATGEPQGYTTNTPPDPTAGMELSNND